jgi:uncharacterized OB-fold protein
MKPLPEVTPENEHFWLGGAADELRLLRCPACGGWVHPPLPRCPDCAGSPLRVEAASGQATVHSVSGTFAVVRLDEGPLLLTNVPAGTRIDQRVGVAFERNHDVWLPVFT